MTTTAPGSTSSTGVGANANAWTAQAAASTAGPLGYDQAKFYVRATDVNGHGEKIGGKLPTEVYAAVQSMIHSGDFPDLQMPMDLVRDAVVHYMHMRKDQIGTVRLREQIDGLLRRLAFEEYAKRMDEDTERWLQISERLTESLTKLSAAGAWGQIWVYLKRTRELLEDIPDPFHSQVERIVDEWRARVPPEFQDDWWS